MASYGDQVILVGSERPARSDIRLVGPADAEEQLTVSLEVRRRPDAPPLPDLEALGAQLPRNRAKINRGAVAASYGADPEDLAKVSAFANAYGLAVEESSAPRRTVRLSGTVGQMSKAFGVRLNTYQYNGDTYRGREGHVMVPRALADIVKRVSGFTNLPLAQPHLLVLPQDVTSFNAAQIGQMYDSPTRVNGAGECIGIIELGGGYSPADLNTYFAALELATPNVVAVSVDGATNGYGSGADGEVELDIEVSGSIAPGATIAMYFAPNTEQGFIDAITTAAQDTVNNPGVLSISWGLAEDLWTTAGLQGMDNAFIDAAMAGITVLAAAGDNGSNDRVYDGHAHCDYPASDPYVIACGGTTLQVKPDETIDEIVWDTPLFGYATGGGISDKWGLPSWQEGKGVPPSVNDGVSTGRGVPDVAGNANPFTGYNVVVDGSWTVEGGTSAVAPLYAGLFALMNQSLGFRLGYITPYLYSLYETDAYVDVTSGTNQVPPAPGYSAGPGWDACSGLGRIDGNNLLTGLI